MFIDSFAFLKVEVSVAPDSVEPGKTVDISVKAKPNSYVGVLGVDQSVLLLKTGNDITQVKVINQAAFSLQCLNSFEFFFFFVE